MKFIDIQYAKNIVEPDPNGYVLETNVPDTVKALLTAFEARDFDGKFETVLIQKNGDGKTVGVWGIPKDSELAYRLYPRGPLEPSVPSPLGVSRYVDIGTVRVMFKGLWFPTSIRKFLQREGVKTIEWDGKEMFLKSHLEALLMDLKR